LLRGEDPPISPAERAMLTYAHKLTIDPANVRRADVDALRAAGLDDHVISHLAQVVALFNYYNRIADGLGIDPEPEPAEAGR
jgi:uncharacterized peroxidase-related enzyme